MRHLIKGNEAVVRGALVAGCKAYFGYPITPASEIAEAASLLLPESGGIFIPAESEIGAIQMLFGAASAGVRAMTASSGPGISLMQEGISYMAGALLPGVIVDIQRAGPGLGNLGVEQGDYHQAVKSGGHGCYRTPVFAPNCVQEMCDLTIHAFEVADRYRNPVIVLADGALGQMMEPIQIPPQTQNEPEKPWAVDGTAATRKNLITSIYLEHEKQEILITQLEQKYAEIENKEVLFQEIQTEDAELLIVAFGISSRIARAAVEIARAEGIRVGLLRPISLYPFPGKRLRQLAGKVYAVLALELSSGQMVEDVRLSISGITPVQLLRRTGGMMPTAEDVVQTLKTMEKECVGNHA
ncbi:MAG: ketoisovalerate ferredoxin oxidoreductase, alpha subunit [Acidobacteria bacterium]|nr:ketoisovalerate ferredoxin oxidoreductase, alpha subunit [Acidobacteriota bacterium]